MPTRRHAADMTTEYFRHPAVFTTSSMQAVLTNNPFAFHHLRSRLKERQPPGTVNAIVEAKMDGAEGQAVNVGGRS